MAPSIAGRRRTRSLEEQINGREIAVMSSVSLAWCLLQAPMFCAGVPRNSALLDDLFKLTVIKAALGGNSINNETIRAIVERGPYMGLERGVLEMTCAVRFKSIIDYPITMSLVGTHDSDVVYGTHFRGYIYCWRTTDEEIASWIKHEVLS